MEASVSVIVPALNESLRIARAVNSAFTAGAGEVIVVDGGSTDDTTQQADKAGALVVNSQPGRAVQQNAGAELARGNVLLFLHADNWLDVDTIQQISQHCQSRAHVAGAFRQSIDAAGLAYRILERGNALRAGWLGRPYGDQGIFVDKQLFADVGCFPDVPLMEDVLIMRQIRLHLRPALLPGPIHVDARRWQQGGIVRQTLRNWSLLAAHTLGWSPDQLARFYPTHQKPDQLSLVISPLERLRAKVRPTLRLASIMDDAFQLVTTNLAIERRAFDAENLGCLALVPTVGIQRGEDLSPFRFGQCHRFIAHTGRTNFARIAGRGQVRQV